MTGRIVSRQELIRRQRRSGLIGRKGEQAAFRDALQQSPEEATQFLFHIHGTAGVGKSTLVRQLESLAREAHALTAYVDESAADVIEAMEAIGAQFAQQGVELKGFDKALANYRQRRHEVDASALSSRVTSGNVEADQDIEQQGPSPSSVIGSQLALAGLGMIPGVGAFTGVLDPSQIAAGADRFKALLSSRLRNHEDVELILSPVQVLTPVFLQGVTEVAGRRPWVVLFFDTYERTGPILDLWLRDILVSDRYGQLPANVLVVLAGQPRLNNQCWGDWLDLVTDLPLEVFSDAEARQLLVAKGITDETVIQIILELSERLPVLVSTLAETHPSSVADVGDPSGTAVERFLKWETNPAHRAAALVCALPQEVDEDTYRAIVDVEARDDFNWLRSMPFFINRAGRGHYHDVVRSAMLRLQRQQSPLRWKEQHNRLAEAFRQRRVQLEEDVPPDDGWWEDERWRSYRLQETYHKLCGDHRTALTHALRELLDARDYGISTFRRWIQSLARAGQDTDAPAVRKWGQELLNALEGPRPGITAITLLLSRGALDDSGKCLAYTLRAGEHRRGKDYDQALADYTNAIEIEPIARAFQRRGETYRLTKQPELALADFNRAIEIDPDNPRSIVSRGQIYRSMDRYEEALADFNHAIELTPENARTIANRGETYRTAGRLEEALNDFNRAIQINPEDAWIISNRGEAFNYLKRREEALVDFSRAIEIDPAYVWALACRGNIYKSMGRYEEALVDLSRAIEIDPAYVWALARRGNIYNSMGRYEEALVDLSRAIEIDPAYVWALNSRARIYKAMNRNQEAIADYTSSIESDPNRAWSLAGRGYLFRLMGQYAEALADCSRALEINSEYPFAIANRGTTYRVLGQYEEALLDLNHAIELDPENAWVNYEMAVALFATQSQGYERHVSRVVELCPFPHIEGNEHAASDMGNLFLAHFLISDWLKADQYLSGFLSTNPAIGEIAELLIAVDTLRQLVPSAQEYLPNFRRRLESARRR
ncbi:tetratricopeptide repeat protein [Streptomyces prunicolor]|uniref:ATP-binding protein n=1 Tax=Streptomyces prunicolor TaxID=67348 RepID=UPI00224EAA5B|nr:ATP-binding protein [Streptomyces prunicolor]MCX5237567.1 tetratricopeptide repeat protein [Streptomyces prunicolor]